MKVATVQLEPVLRDVTASVERAVPAARRALEQADLVVLPELSDTGYDLGSREAALALATPAEENPLVRKLVSACRDLGGHAVAGICERDGGDVFNSAILVGADGIAGVYRKIHLFMNEKDIFSPGDRIPPVIDVGAGRIGLLICFDWMFPEVWRSLALDGADVVCHPSNLVLPYAQQAALVHALVNRYYVATANRIGAEGDLRFTGGSQIADPDGKRAASSPADEPHVAVATIDLARSRSKTVTPKNDALADRRPELYGKVVTTPSPINKESEEVPGGKNS